MIPETKLIGLVGLFAVLACVTPTHAGVEAEPRRQVAVGGGFISAGEGDHIPFAKSGGGLTGQFWYIPLRWLAAGTQIGWYRVNFDRAALHDRIEGVSDPDLSTSPYTIIELAFLIRAEPVAVGGWRPFLDVGISSIEWHEQYSCNDITPGPWFPSGTLIDVDRTIRAVGLATGGGIRYEHPSGAGFVLEAQGLFARGDEIEGRWLRFQALISWGF